jgi:magnesium chelatase family protein
LRPGEVTLAHRGLLFLDELPEFAPRLLDALREPLTDGVVRLARASGAREFPARFQLVAAANPCRCGHRGSRTRACVCSEAERARYLARLSGPLRDRFDLAVELGDAPPAPLTDPPAKQPPSAGPAGDDPATGDLRAEVSRARAILASGREPPATWDLGRKVRAHGLQPEAMAALEQARGPLDLTARGMLRACRVARTVAALGGRREVTAGDVREALLYRHEALGCWRAAEG